MRVGIVSDQPRETEALIQAMALAPEHDVIWTANTAAEAVELCARKTPNLVLMGLLAGMEGVEATHRIMAGSPCPIVPSLDCQ